MVVAEFSGMLDSDWSAVARCTCNSGDWHMVVLGGSGVDDWWKRDSS